jgi:hypothetical protein
MKKLNIKYSLFFLVLIFSQYGCKKDLNLTPLDKVNDAIFYKTPNDFMLAANAFYSYEQGFNDVLFDSYSVGGVNYNSPHYDGRGDIIAERNTFSEGVNASVTTDNNYNLAYTRIYNINYMLGKAAAYTTPADIKTYVAEAKFFRAYVYFNLLQMYGGVPILTKILSTTSPELQAPRNTRDQVVNFILSDLNAAITDLPTSIPVGSATYGRISQGAAQSFLGRVALYEGTWQKFRSNASRGDSLLTVSKAASYVVISRGQYSLFQPAALGDSAQKYLFILEDEKSNPASIQKASNNEYVLANRYSSTLRQININVTHTASSHDLTRQFANLYLCQDGLPVEKSPLFQGYSTLISEFANRDNRMRYNMKVSGKYYYTGQNNYRVDWMDGAADRASADGGQFLTYNGSTLTAYRNQKWETERQVPDFQEGEDYPVIRYAEVLLNYAEATFELNGSISDVDLNLSLNLVRQRVNKSMPALTNNLVSANGLDMRTEIRRERTIELYYEGFRVDDLKRWNVATTVLGQPLLGVLYTGTQYQTLWTAGASLPRTADGIIIADSKRQFSDKNYLLPIPTQQIQLNPNLTQNPGW